MVSAEWVLKGPQLATCNCDFSCPCQFNARPTHGNCRAAVGMRIDEGHLGDVRLDGLHWAGLFAWPGAIHEGRGEALPIVDERADERQREAILTILSGQASEPGATYFDVFASTLETMHEPQFLPIQFEMDLDGRTGRFVVPGVVEARSEPIRNPVTGKEHRARVTLPHGFEYLEAEFASATTRATGPIALDWANAHAHLSMQHIGPHGPIR